MSFGEVILTFVLPTLISVLMATFSGIYLYRKRTTKNKKIELLENLITYRGEPTSDIFLEAINKVIVVFNDSNEVLEKLDDFHESATTQYKDNNIVIKRLLSLVKEIYKDLGLKYNLNDSLFKKPFKSSEELYALKQQIKYQNCENQNNDN